MSHHTLNNALIFWREENVSCFTEIHKVAYFITIIIQRCIYCDWQMLLRLQIRCQFTTRCKFWLLWPGNRHCRPLENPMIHQMNHCVREVLKTCCTIFYLSTDVKPFSSGLLSLFHRLTLAQLSDVNIHPFALRTHSRETVLYINHFLCEQFGQNNNTYV